MKLLAVDIGNTNIVFGIFENNKLIKKNRIKTTETDIKNIDFLSGHKIAEIVVSSVVPKLSNQIINYSKKYLHLIPTFITYNIVKDLVLDVENPHQVGTDRICNIIAARFLYKLPAIVVDMGTATKYDVINKSGIFIGGIISPGIELSAKNLFNKAALLSKIPLKFPKTVIGKNTETNIQSGIMYGALDSINGMLHRIQQETKWKKCSVIVTGGFSELIKHKVKNNYIINSNLTLEGIQLIYNRIKN